MDSCDCEYVSLITDVSWRASAQFLFLMIDTCRSIFVSLHWSLFNVAVSDGESLTGSR